MSKIARSVATWRVAALMVALVWLGAARPGLAQEATPCESLPTLYGFEVGEAVIPLAMEAQLEAVAACLSAAPEAGLRIEAHTDVRGTSSYNLQLSRRQAGSIQRFLTRLGIDASRLETFGYGEARPLVEGDGESAWRQNRRVELHWQSEAQCSSPGECPAGYQCDGGHCVNRCDEATLCPETWHCVEGTCVACAGDADCGAGEHCSTGLCFACVEDAHCGGGACVQGACVDP